MREACLNFKRIELAKTAYVHGEIIAFALATPPPPRFFLGTVA